MNFSSEISNAIFSHNYEKSYFLLYVKRLSLKIFFIRFIYAIKKTFNEILFEFRFKKDDEFF